MLLASTAWRRAQGCGCSLASTQPNEHVFGPGVAGDIKSMAAASPEANRLPV